MSPFSDTVDTSSPLNDTVDPQNDNISLHDEEEEGEEPAFPAFDSKPTHEAKIRQLLRNINSTELQLCSEGCKEFMKLLRGAGGGKLLYEYIRLSGRLTELLEAWNRRKGKGGMCYVMNLISVLLGHCDGVYKQDDYGRVGVSRVLDRFAKGVVEERMEDLYKEIKSKEGKRQKAALVLLASVVRRGSLLAAEVAKSFDFKMQGFGKLSGFRKKKVGRGGYDRHSTRGAFVEFAMSFLEVGKPGLLKSILQQREVFSGILRGLGDDDDETVVYVLSTLRDRVLTPGSLVPPGLRSVLFGSATLEQLVDISARGEDVLAAKVAYEVLGMVCIDPSNGLMPDVTRKPVPLKGNLKRLVDLMKKLKGTEVEYHRKLLLAIVNGRPTLASTYLDQFPYNLEDHASSSWLSGVTLAADVIASVRGGMAWDFLARLADDMLAFENSDVQSVFRCVCLRSFSRMVVNKGLLHSDPLIKHGTLRLLLEVLKLFDSFMGALTLNKLSSLKQRLQDEVRILLPDPQVLFTLLSSVGGENSRSALKRAADSESVGRHKAAPKKKRKIDILDEDIDILVCGVDSAPEGIIAGESETPKEEATLIQFDDKNGDGELIRIWSSDESSSASDMVQNAEVYFHCKVLEALKIYHRTLRDVLGVSYDILKVLPSNPLELPSILLQSLLSMLIEHFGCSMGLGFSSMLPPIYKQLQSFLILSLHSSNGDVRQQAYNLAKVAMMSTGAFDHNLWETGSWLLFLPGNVGGKFQEIKSYDSLSLPVVSFLCDAVSTVGNNLIKYWNILKCGHSNVGTGEETNVGFSPLVICVLEKCLRLLGSGSGSFTLPEKSLISLYVCNTLKYLLQTQVEAGKLAAVIHQLLSERIENHISIVADVETRYCEWRPLVSLMFFSRSIQCQETCNACSIDRTGQEANSSLANTLADVKGLLSAGSTEGYEVFKALYATIICTAPDDVLDNLPSVMAILRELPEFHHCIINYFGVDHSVMKRVCEQWPGIFYSGLEMSILESGKPTENNCKEISKKTPSTNFETEEYASMYFGSLLKDAPFYTLFPALIFCDQEHCSEIKQLLVAKVSNLTVEHIVSSLRLILFWFHQLQLSYRKKSCKQLEWRSELCYTLLEHFLGLMSSLKVDCRSPADATEITFSLCIEEVAKTVFAHPAVTAALSSPLGHIYEPTEEFLKEISKGLLCLSGERICTIELHVLKLVTATLDMLLRLCNRECCSSLSVDCKENVVKAFKNLVQWIFVNFMDRFHLWYRSQNMTLLPVFYAVIALVRFISPIDLLELAKWIFATVEPADIVVSGTPEVSPACLAFSIACAAFDRLSQYIHSPSTKEVLTDLFWVTRIESLDATLFQSIYFEAFNSATSLKIDLADACLLKALSAAHSITYRQDLLSFSMEITRVIASTPIKLVSHCVYRTNNTKAKILLLLIEKSPLHSSVFAHLLSGIISEDNVQEVNSAEETRNESLLDEEYLMLLPAAVSYISASRTQLRDECSRNIKFIPEFYARLLLDGFLNWEQFVSGAIFQVEYSEPLLWSVDDLHDLLADSLLGKALNMLQRYFASNEDKNKRLKLFCSVFPVSSALSSFLDLDIREFDLYSVGQLLNLSIRAMAKISLCLALLFPEGYEKCPLSEIQDEEGQSELRSGNEASLRIRFLDTLVYVWQQLVKKFPSSSNLSDQNSPTFTLLKSLEVFTLRCINKLTLEMHDILIGMDSLSFLEKMAKVSLLHRFGDPVTFEYLRHILSSLSDGNLPVALVLQLLLGHSQLASAVGTVVESSNSTVSGILVKPISSFLRSLNFHTERSHSRKIERYKSRLEVIKLLRLLFHLRACKQGSVSEDDLGVNLRELVLLLLSSFGATVGDVDLEITSLISEIDSAGEMGCRTMAEMDYLWGIALTYRKEGQIEHGVLKNDMADMEEESRRSLFRDRLPVDPKLLIETILYFPYKRTTSRKTFFSDSNHQDANNTLEEHIEVERFEVYDPVFVLSLSIHSLSMGYLDALEFAGLGLLAVALMSIASPEDEIRKLGYEVLGGFKDALKRCQRKREVTRLKLLLTYLQNGIEEQWQKIPTISAVFLAEASVVLLDPSHEHYLAISKFLLQSPRINLKTIPLFQDIFWSSSVNFRTDRLWMLRLLYTGINYEDDALILIRNSVPEILLSVYASSLSDIESKEFILQVVKKCVKIQKMARHLVENCCLISWLSSVLTLSMSLTDGDDVFFSKQFVLLLEIVDEIVSSESILEWLQKHGLEQLSGLSCNLFNLFVTSLKLVPKTVPSVMLTLKVIVSTLEISQKRNIYQPHFTPSMRSLYLLYEATDSLDGENFSQCAEFGLKAILMSMPPTTISDVGLEELSKFLIWAVSTARRSDSQQALQEEGSLTSTLLRWLVASIILQRLPCSPGDFVVRGEKRETLLSLMEQFENGGGVSKVLSGYEEILAAAVFHLQQLLGMKCSMLASVVAALSILLLADGSHPSGDASGHAASISYPSYWSKICYPSEAKPAWRWSFHQPLADLTTEEYANLDRMNELHACQNLLVIISRVLGKKASNCELLSSSELESSGLFEWERTNFHIK